MSFRPKTDWKYDDVVTEHDLNRIEQGIVDAADQAETNANHYTDEQIQLVTETGVPKLVTYPYVLTASEDGQTDFEIPLETFSLETDTVSVVQNSITLNPNIYTIEGRTVKLAQGVTAGTVIFLQVWKNVPIGEEGGVSGTVIADSTIGKRKLDEELQGEIEGFVAHKVDLVKHPAVATTTNIGNAYTVNLNPVLTSYENGMGIVATVNADSTGASTLNIDGLGAVPIKKANGRDVNNLKANGVYTLRYSSGVSSFILQGEGGEGTAQPEQVLIGETFTNDEDTKVGTMPNNSRTSLTTLTTITQQGDYFNIPEGFHKNTRVRANFSNLTSGNIRSGVNIGGVTGALNVYTGERILLDQFNEMDASIYWEAGLRSNNNSVVIGNSLRVRLNNSLTPDSTVVTKNRINLAGINKIIVVYQVSNFFNDWYTKMSLSSSKTTGVLSNTTRQFELVRGSQYANEPTYISCDVADLSGTYYIKFGYQGAGGSGTTYNLDILSVSLI